MALSMVSKNFLTKLNARRFLLESCRVTSIRTYRYLEPEHWDPIKQTFKSNPSTERFEAARFPGEYDVERPKGKIYDKKPFKFTADAGKKYSWCSCGHSRKQPFCDGRHKSLDGSSFEKRTPKYRPIRFQLEETKDVWLCNCKQSSNRPYCDGTHKRDDIQAAIR